MPDPDCGELIRPKISHRKLIPESLPSENLPHPDKKHRKPASKTCTSKLPPKTSLWKTRPLKTSD